MGSYDNNTEILVRGEAGTVTVSNIPEQPQQSIAPREQNTGKIDVNTQPEMTPDKKSDGYDPPISPTTPAHAGRIWVANPDRSRSGYKPKTAPKIGQSCKDCGKIMSKISTFRRCEKCYSVGCAMCVKACEQCMGIYCRACDKELESDGQVRTLHDCQVIDVPADMEQAAEGQSDIELLKQQLVQ